MRRRMPLLIATLAIAALVGVALAQPVLTPAAYLPLIHVEIPPTPIPTPVPPDISTLTIQPFEVKPGYARDTFKLVTNADAAKTYKDPKAASKAFQAQGRETSWYVLYTSTLYAADDAIGISDQVYRYATPVGATSGQAYGIAERQRDNPDFHVVDVPLPCCLTIALDRTFVDSGIAFEQVLISTQVGRYVVDVQVLWVRSSAITVDRIVAYAQTGVNHLLATPQVIQSSHSAIPLQQPPSDAVIPSLDHIRAASSPH